MVLNFLRRPQYTYTPLNGDRKSKTFGFWNNVIPLLSVLGLLLAIVFLSAASFAAGRSFATDATTSQLDFGRISQIFSGNECFIGRPTVQKEHAWDSLFPPKGGFFIHPTVAQTKSVFSAFHHLHCLENMWKSWWLLYTAVGNGTRLAGDQMLEMLNPRHVNHCVELLRLSLMCQPDLTIEEVTENGGVPGFGIMHTCRSWDILLSWVGEWEA